MSEWGTAVLPREQQRSPGQMEGQPLLPLLNLSERFVECVRVFDGSL